MPPTRNSSGLCLTQQTNIRLSRRFRSAQALTVKARSIEAANASLPGSEHRTGIFDPARARLCLFGGADPVDPISARVGRDIRPQRSRLRGGDRESFSQIRRHFLFRFLRRGCDLQRDDVAYLCAGSFGQLSVHFEPVAFLAVWLERGLKDKAIDGAFDRRHPSRRQLRAGILWQDEKGPGVRLLALVRPEEFRFETNRGFRHLPNVIDKMALFGRSSALNRVSL